MSEERYTLCRTCFKFRTCELLQLILDIAQRKAGIQFTDCEEREPLPNG